MCNTVHKTAKGSCRLICVYVFEDEDAAIDDYQVRGKRWMGFWGKFVAFRKVKRGREKRVVSLTILAKRGSDFGEKRV